tara:strand:- start:323 stop:625 length:303 start_codon:yes stop_codon:yes gene_type:complete
MSRDTPTKKYDINFNEDCLNWYSGSEYPRFAICVNYWEKEILEEEYIEYFCPDNTEDLLDYINIYIQEDLNKFDDIENIELIWEKNCCDFEVIDRIYDKN